MEELAPPTTDMPSMRSEPSTAPDLDEVLNLEPSLLNIGLILQTLMQAARRQQAEHGARMAALDARLKELEDDGAEEETLFSDKAGVTAVGAFGKLALRGKRSAKLKAEEALKQEIQAQVAAALAVAKQESAAEQAAAVSSALAAQQQAAQHAQLLAQQAGEAGQEAAVAAALAAQQQAQLLAQQEQAEQQAAQQAQAAQAAQQGQGQLAQQLAEQQARQERVEASLAAVVDMLYYVEEVDEEGDSPPMEERSAIPLSERASKMEQLEGRIDRLQEELVELAATLTLTPDP